MGTQNAMSQKLSAIQNAAMHETPMAEDELRDIFRALDPDDKGIIQEEEFLKSLKIFGGDNAFTDEEISVLKKEMGMDGSGFKYNEFLALRQVLLNRKL